MMINEVMKIGDKMTVGASPGARHCRLIVQEA